MQDNIYTPKENTVEEKKYLKHDNNVFAPDRWIT